MVNVAMIIIIIVMVNMVMIKIITFFTFLASVTLYHNPNYVLIAAKSVLLKFSKFLFFLSTQSFN